MKKFAVLAILLVAFAQMLFASNLTIDVTSKGVKVYNSFGRTVAGSTLVEDGWFLTTEKESEVTLTSSSFIIQVTGGSIISNGSESDGTPYVFLMNGIITVKHSENGGKLNIYTPSRLYKINGTCVITVISDSTHDSYGINAGTATLYDAIRGTTTELEYKEVAIETPAKTVEAPVAETPVVQTPVVQTPVAQAAETQAVEEPVKEAKEEKKTNFSFGAVAFASSDYKFTNIGPFTAMPFIQIGGFLIGPQVSFTLADFATPESIKALFAIDTENGGIALYNSILKYIGQISYDGALSFGLTSREDFSFRSPVMLDLRHEFDSSSSKSFFLSLDLDHFESKLFLQDITLHGNNSAEFELTAKFSGISFGASVAMNVTSFGTPIEFSDIQSQIDCKFYPSVHAGLTLMKWINVEAFATTEGFDFTNIQQNFTAGASASLSILGIDVKAGAVMGRDQLLYGFIGNQTNRYSLTGTGTDIYEFFVELGFENDVVKANVSTAIPLVFSPDANLVTVTPGISPEVTNISLELKLIENILSIEGAYQSVAVAATVNSIVSEAITQFKNKAFDFNQIKTLTAKLFDPAYAQYYARVDFAIGEFVGAYAQTAENGLTLGARLFLGKRGTSKVDF